MGRGPRPPSAFARGAFTLPVLWKEFGTLVSAQELLFHYLKCPKVVKTKHHPRGSQYVRGAAFARRRATGHWGHGR